MLHVFLFPSRALQGSRVFPGPQRNCLPLREGRTCPPFIGAHRDRVDGKTFCNLLGMEQDICQGLRVLERPGEDSLPRFIG